jgi:hypothetical protein
MKAFLDQEVRRICDEQPYQYTGERIDDIKTGELYDNRGYYNPNGA